MAAPVAPIVEEEDGEMHPRRRLLSTGAAAGGGSSSRPGGTTAAGPSAATSLLDRLNHYAGSSRFVVALLISIVCFSYLSQEFEALSVFPASDYESETTVRPPSSSSSWTHKTSQFIASLRDAGSSLLRGPSSSSSSGSSSPACRSFFAVCPMDYHGTQDMETDPMGNTPFVCTQSEAAPSEAPSDMHVFNVSICRGPARLQLLIDHVHGFVDSAANRRYQNGPDLIETQIVGPELRLVAFENVHQNSSLYRANIGAAVPGEYHFDVTVSYTPFREEETAGKEPQDWPFFYVRNLVLVANETWTPTEVALAELEKDKAATRALADGRWVRVGTEGYPHARSEMYMPEARVGRKNGYRCQHVGEYAWTPRAQEESSSWERFRETEQIHECLRRAKPATSTNNYTRIVMYGDSQSRTTLNGFLNLIFPDDETMRAQKNFKSTTESQCFGGAAFGFEVCFQWNAWVADRPNVEPMLEKFDRVTANIGHWQCVHGGFQHWKEAVEGNIRSLAELHQNLTARGEGDRLLWLQMSLIPEMNRADWLDEKDERQLPKMLHINSYADRLMEEVQLPQLRVQGILMPFHDCSEDQAHFHYGLAETVAKEKILPWLCPE